ncbi:SDR family NAD(P)-dependent oxidoreductase [Magnetovibrio sp. PR-2]|uniref:SDR family NAD(P)-dependent oxidoreductase n=1 Tax=Magnetovibrio sp. PR-2 TaxID=3120356 RepID=UPI002FCE0EA5
MQGPLDGKSALITGAVGGIGLIAARALAQTGCELHLVGQNFSKLYEAAQDIRETFGVTVEQRMGNPASPVDAEAIGMASADADIFLSCTGNLPRGTLEDIEDGQWRKSWEQAVFAPLNMAREMTGHMNDEERGLIVLVIDAPAKTDNADICASVAGAALKTLIEGLAQELVKGVRIVGLLTERRVDARKLAETFTRLTLNQEDIATGSVLTCEDILKSEEEE